MKRDTLGKFEGKAKVISSHTIELGEYDRKQVSVFMDPQGAILVQVGALQFTTETLLRLTLDAIANAAILRKHAG